jgi:hypothetical protein
LIHPERAALLDDEGLAFDDDAVAKRERADEKDNEPRRLIVSWAGL